MATEIATTASGRDAPADKDSAAAEDEFRPLRLQNGLYIQRHAPMLRIAVPYGLVSSAQLRTLAHVATFVENLNLASVEDVSVEIL